MTRINVVPVSELSDQHLIAEYRELPRVIKQDIDVSDAPKKYCLGKGHMKWARKHVKFILKRYKELCDEMEFRGFKVNYSWSVLVFMSVYWGSTSEDYYNDYKITRKDLTLNRNRLIEKYCMKSNWYRWTKREKPKYMET